LLSFTDFYSALVPTKSSAPRCAVTIVDTVLLARGRPTRWIYTAQNKEVTEKLHVDKESIHATYRQSALANPNNLGRVVMLARRGDGGVEVMSAEAAAEYMRTSESADNAGVLALQVS
jgi:hypothetical protein